MSILNQLARTVGHRGEVPNQELAIRIADNKDKKAVKELVDNLANKDRDVQYDCIKTLYEIGVLAPKLIAAYLPTFQTLLHNKNNRMIWGAMCAIDSITLERPDDIYNMLPEIAAAAEKGSVVAKDHAVSLMVKLAGDKKYNADALALLREQLLQAAGNQFPSYCEKIATVMVTEEDKADFIQLFKARLDTLESDTKKKRVLKALKKLQK